MSTKPLPDAQSASSVEANSDFDRIGEVAKLENDLSNICRKIYELGAQRIKPLHPWMIVRVLPKEHITEGGILLADTAQNKPVYEGIVLETWAPYEEVRFKETDEGKGERIKERVFIQHECSVKVGDRITFPHYEGFPIPYLDEKYYRMVREGTDQNKNPYCGVFGIVDYSGDKKVKEQLRRLWRNVASVTTSGVATSKGNID